MKRRIVSALAIAALLAVGIAGARGQPMDEPEFDLMPTPSEPASATVTSGLEIISGNDRAMVAGNQVLAGVNSTKLGTEMIY